MFSSRYFLYYHSWASIVGARIGRVPQRLKEWDVICVVIPTFLQETLQKKLCHVKLCLKLSLKRDITVEYIGNKTKIIFIANVNTTLLEQCIECVIVFRDTEQTSPDHCR